MSARLLFIGTWNFADDYGNLDRSAKQIKARVFPLDSINCEPLIQELIAQNLLIEYEVDGKKYLHIQGFAKHQVINRPSKPGVPAFDKAHVTLTEPSVSTHAGREGKGKERKGSKGDAAPAEPVAGLELGVWERWIEYRRSSGKPVKPASVTSAQRMLAEFGRDQAAVVERSIANGWQGLFPLSTVKGLAGFPASDDAVKAWAELLATDGARRDAKVQAALDACGGWLAIKGRNSFTEAKLRAEFCDAYRRAA